MMKKLILVVLVACGLAACPDPQTGKVSPYLTARTIINQANTALALADGIFTQWMLGQADAEKAKKAQTTYVRVKTAVANGLQVAYAGVGIAEQAKRDPDVAKLLAQADEAWKALSKLLGGLLGAGDPGVTVVLAAGSPPASQPAAKGTVGSKTSALTTKSSPLNALPASLIP